MLTRAIAAPLGTLEPRQAGQKRRGPLTAAGHRVIATDACCVVARQVGPARGIVYGARREIELLAAGHAGERGAMIGTMGPSPERTPLSAEPLVLARGVSLPVPGCSGGSRHGPG